MTKRKALLVGGVFVMVIGLGLVLMFALGGENPNVRRGKELLSIDEYSAAAKEFKIFLKKEDSHDKEVQALLLYSLAKSEEKEMSPLVSLFSAQPTVDMIARSAWPDYIDDESRSQVEKEIVKMRRLLFEQGVDTKDAAELSAILLEAARFVLEKREGKEEKDFAAFVLAKAGNKEAVSYLIERMKGTDTDLVETLLVLLGAGVAPSLQDVVKDPNNLARDKALSILSKVLVVDAAKRVFSAHPRARAIALDDLPEPLRTDENGQLLESQYVSGITRLLMDKGIQLGASTWVKRNELHTSYSKWYGTDDQGVLILSGYDVEKKAIFSYLFHFTKGEYHPLKIRLKGKSLEALIGSAPVVRSEILKNDVIALARPETVPIEFERIRGRAKISPGARVAIQGHKGTVRSMDDAGLVNVQLDQADRGETEVVILPSVLRGVVKEIINRPGYRAYVGRIKEGALAIRKDLSPVTEDVGNLADAASFDSLISKTSIKGIEPSVAQTSQ